MGARRDQFNRNHGQGPLFQPQMKRVSSRPIVPLLAVVVTALALLAMPALASARGATFGIAEGVHPDDQDIAKMQNGGVEQFRFGFNWPSIQQSQGSCDPVQGAGTCDWSETDQLVGGLAAKGIPALPVLFGTPHWISHNQVKPPLGSAGQRDAWQSFLKAAVKRYGPGGTYWTDIPDPLGLMPPTPGPYHTQFGPNAPVTPIRAWQIWNEPNGIPFWAPRPSAKQYAKLLGLSRQAIASADPGADIILAGLVGYGKIRAWNFLDQLYRAHAKPDFDAAALHPYARNLNQLRNEVVLYRAAMKQHRDPHTPLWITELGWGSANRGGHYNRGLSGQKRILSQSFKMLVHHSAWRINHLFWFDWRDPGSSRVGPPGCTWCASAGLLKHNRNPKPAYRAFKHFTGG
jgi:Glycosyl hydrolase catalytic core